MEYRKSSKPQAFRVLAIPTFPCHFIAGNLCPKLAPTWQLPDWEIILRQASVSQPDDKAIFFSRVRLRIFIFTTATSTAGALDLTAFPSRINAIPPGEQPRPLILIRINN